LTDLEWNVIRRFLPAQRTGKAGRPWKPHRQVINGILFVLHTGISWHDLPQEFGKVKTVYNRFRRWGNEGIWQRIFEALIERLLKSGDIDFELWCVDGTVIRAHRVASGAQKGDLSTAGNAEKQAFGRSRGGYSTKLHFLTDGQGIPLGVTATAGQRNEAREFENVMAACQINLFHQAKRPQAFAADKAYSSETIRGYIARLQIEEVIPTRSNEPRDDDFDKAKYKQRNIVERSIGWIKEHRRIATRYEKLVDNDLAMVHLAVARMIINWN